MVRFFRTLQQRLVTENRFSKYLMYAVGEIFLVMIGILLALQVNTWNEQRKETELFHSYLFRLKEDFTEILSAPERPRLAGERLIALGDMILNSFEKDTAGMNPRQFAVAPDGTAGIYFYKKTSQTCEDLISTGNVKLLSNHQLRSQIGAYNSLIDPRNFQIQEWSTFNLKYREVTRNILTPEERLTIIGAWPFGYADDPHSKNFRLLTSLDEMKSRLWAIPDIKGILTDVIRSRKNTLFFIDQELGLLRGILTAIDEEETKFGNYSHS